MAAALLLAALAALSYGWTLGARQVPGEAAGEVTCTSPGSTISRLVSAKAGATISATPRTTFDARARS